MPKSTNPYDRSVRSLNDADTYEFSGESEYSRDRSDPFMMVDYLIDRGIDFRGRGLRGFRLTDSTIREDVCEILTRDPYINASEIEVAVNGGCVLLTGCVDSRQTKRLAEICIEDMPGVVEIINQLKFETGTRRS